MQGRLVELYCDEVKQHKLDGLRAELEEESVAYLQEKAETLRLVVQHLWDVVNPLVHHLFYPAESNLDYVYQRRIMQGNRS